MRTIQITLFAILCSTFCFAQNDLATRQKSFNTEKNVAIQGYAGGVGGVGFVA